MLGLLPDILGRIKPGTTVFLGSHSSFIDIAPVEEMTVPSYLGNLTKIWEKRFKRFYEGAKAEYSSALKNCNDPEKIKAAKAKVGRTKRNTETFIPFDQRPVKSMYWRFQMDGLAVIIEGEETGNLWYEQEKHQAKHISSVYYPRQLNVGGK